MPSQITQTSYTFTRPSDTTAYAQGDLIANSTTAGSVVPMSFNVGKGGKRIKAMIISKSATGVTSSDVMINLLTSSPTVANGDNGAISINTSGKFFRGSFGTVMVASTNGAYGYLNGQDINIYTSTGVIYGLLEANAAYTPASGETFTVTLIVENI